MKAINLNKEEEVVLVLTKNEIFTLCTGLATLKSKYLQEDKFDMYDRTFNLYNKLIMFEI